MHFEIFDLLFFFVKLTLILQTPNRQSTFSIHCIIVILITIPIKIIHIVFQVIIISIGAVVWCACPKDTMLSFSVERPVMDSVSTSAG